MEWFWQIFRDVLQATLALNALVASYPDHISSHDYVTISSKDGTQLPIGPVVGFRTLNEMRRAPTIIDQFAIPYPLGRVDQRTGPLPNQDPGRIRNQEFFAYMYGDCRANEVASRLVRVPWIPSRGGGVVLATTVNGVAARLQAVSGALERLPPHFMKFVIPTAGTYNCRDVSGTNQLSMHAYGAAIDINVKFGDYWRWSKGPVVWRNRIPHEIIEAFEAQGFIWGGKWLHYDTLHFEYRPELILLAKYHSPEQSRRDRIEK